MRIIHLDQINLSFPPRSPCSLSSTITSPPNWIHAFFKPSELTQCWSYVLGLRANNCKVDSPWGPHIPDPFLISHLKVTEACFAILKVANLQKFHSFGNNEALAIIEQIMTRCLLCVCHFKPQVNCLPIFSDLFCLFHLTVYVSSRLSTFQLRYDLV